MRPPPNFKGPGKCNPTQDCSQTLVCVNSTNEYHKHMPSFKTVSVRSCTEVRKANIQDYNNDLGYNHNKYLTHICIPIHKYNICTSLSLRYSIAHKYDEQYLYSSAPYRLPPSLPHSFNIASVSLSNFLSVPWIYQTTFCFKVSMYDVALPKMFFAHSFIQPDHCPSFKDKLEAALQISIASENRLCHYASHLY